jgi:hypothetical protein
MQKRKRRKYASPVRNVLIFFFFSNTYSYDINLEANNLHICYSLTSVQNNCIFLGYYAASSDNSLPMLWDKLSVPSLRVKNPKGTLQDWTDILSWNTGKELPLLSA